MKEYIVRINDDGSIEDMVELTDEDDDPCAECQDCYQLEQTLLAIIQGLREEIAGLKGRIKDLEGRPYITINEPVTVPYNPLITDPNTTNCPDPWWTHNQVTCKH